MQGVLTTEQVLEKLGGAFQAASKKIDADMREQEWLKKRMGRITGSEVYRLFTSKLKIANNATSETLIRQKVAELFGAKMPKKYSRAIEWGNQYEVEAVEAYMEKTGETVLRYGDDQQFVPYGQYGGGTPDGLIFPDTVQDGVKPTGGIEVKCPYVPANHVGYMLNETQEQFKSNHVDHYCQIQNNILVTGAQWFDFVSYAAHEGIREDKRLFILRIHRDDDFIKDLEKALDESSQKIAEYYAKLR